MPISLDDALKMVLPKFQEPTLINISGLTLDQLSDDCPWFLLAEDPDTLREEILEGYEDYLCGQPKLFDGEEWKEDVVPFAIITHEDGGIEDLTTMLFFMLSEGDEGTCPIAVCYSDEFALQRVCNRIEDLVSAT
ncbi:MAG: hypothetical protein JKY56_02625 [Kofleriaceae bacterium]|nr:hypothetical protein [Kofleriaceae bacterium]